MTCNNSTQTLSPVLSDVRNINELEFVDGYIYANLWYNDKIIRIDPKTGFVSDEINMVALYPIAKRSRTADCLNGIAYDGIGKIFYVTGKQWPVMYAVSFVTATKN